MDEEKICKAIDTLYKRDKGYRNPYRILAYLVGEYGSHKGDFQKVCKYLKIDPDIESRRYTDHENWG